MVTTILVVGPLLPGMAHKINPAVQIGAGLERLFSFNWLYGFFLSIALYVGLHFAVPDAATTIPAVVYGLPPVLEGESLDGDSERQSVIVMAGKKA